MAWEWVRIERTSRGATGMGFSLSTPSGNIYNAKELDCMGDDGSNLRCGGKYVYDALDQLAAEYDLQNPSTPQRATCYLTYDHLDSLSMFLRRQLSAGLGALYLAIS